MPEPILPGTHREVAPEVTWSRVEPLLRRFGITRVADVTRLDTIGIPVMLAVRPSSETLAVSQGKGATPLLAKLSAVMESIELWHAEQPTIATWRAAAQNMSLPYELSDLNLTDHVSRVDEFTLAWTEGISLVDGARVPVPADAVRLSFSREHFWHPRILRSGSTGLASGNTWTEACLHALYEAIERDALAPGRGREDRLPVDPRTVEDKNLRDLLGHLDAASVSYEITFIPNRHRVPTFTTRVWSPLFPIVCAGSGSHSDPHIALSRAVAEAVQSRLTEITATRDDIPSDQDLIVDSAADPGFGRPEDGIALEQALVGCEEGFMTMEDELTTVAGRVVSSTGRAPLCVDLSSHPELFSVVRVVAPGLAWAEGRTLAY